MLSSLLNESPKSVLLLGPRQVGKSTLIRSLEPNLEINLADQAEFLEFTSNPNELKQRINASSPQTVFIDEVQKLPSLLDTIQSMIDRPTSQKIKFYLSGSSARKLRRGEANLLPGRLFTYQLGPLTSSELDYKADTRRGLETGFLPEPYFMQNQKFQEKLLSSYAATYLTEEIQAEALTRNLEGFSRFIYVAAEVSGKVLDFSKVSSKAKISRQSCIRFFEILEDTLIASKVLPCPFIEDADLVKHPKYYFFDVGVLNGVLGNFIASQDRIGLLFEHLIYNQLKQSAFAKDKRIHISSFRTRGGLEIDFIVKLENDVWAIEVKSGSSISATELNPLKKFSTYYNKPFQSVVATLDGSSKKENGIWILPWQSLLKEMGL